jgi:hypothetical protein
MTTRIVDTFHNVGSGSEGACQGPRGTKVHQDGVLQMMIITSLTQYVFQLDVAMGIIGGVQARDALTEALKDLQDERFVVPRSRDMSLIIRSSSTTSRIRSSKDSMIDFLSQRMGQVRKQHVTKQIVLLHGHTQ